MAYYTQRTFSQSFRAMYVVNLLYNYYSYTSTTKESTSAYRRKSKETFAANINSVCNKIHDILLLFPWPFVPENLCPFFSQELQNSMAATRQFYYWQCIIPFLPSFECLIFSILTSIKFHKTRD
jgi:hypothetical protein